MSDITPIENENKTIKPSEMDEIKPITIKFTDRDSVYTLEFNRNVVKTAEKNGFFIDIIKAEGMFELPNMSNIEELFYYSFQMHHRGISKNITDKILYEDLGGLNSKILERLVMLYQKTYSTLLKDDDESDSKNSVAFVEM